MFNQRIRAAVLLIENQRVLLIKHVEPDSGETWWVPPGGGLEDFDENVLACAAREVLEESGLSVQVGRLVYWREYREHASMRHFLELFFLAESCSGKLTIKNIHGKGPDEDYIKDARWLSREELNGLTVYPKELHDSFWDDLAQGFPEVRYLGRH